MSQLRCTALAVAAALASSASTGASAAPFACDHLLETTERTLSLDAELPGGAAAHGGYVTPAITAAGERCAEDGWENMISVFADGEGLCAYPGEQIVMSSSTLCESICHYLVETTERAIDVDAELPGGAAPHGGYVTAHIAPANERCLDEGWSTMIVTFADGEGFCAYPGERVLTAGSGPCAATCDFSFETTERMINVGAAWPGGAAAHGGYVLPHLAPANARCLAEGFATMIVTFADGEGFCAAPGEQVVRAAPVDCDAACNFAVQTTHRTIDVAVDLRGGEAAHGGYVLPHLAPANARCAPAGAEMIVVFADGEGLCAHPGEQLLDPAPLGCF